MKAYYSDHFVLPLPDGHRFPMAKYARLRARVVAEGVVPAADVIEASAASWDELELAHTAAYVGAVRNGTLTPDVVRRIGFPWSPGMVERSRRSAGATIAAARSALTDGVAANLAGGTHHAFADRGEGYCVFNDVAIAARVLQRDTRCRRLAVVDCDVHQGNGTAAIFRDDPSVFTFSMHGAKNFPFKKETSDLDVELADGTTDDHYLALLDHHLLTVVREHAPDLVFYLAGADPFVRDRLGRLGLTMAGLQTRDQRVFAACRAAAIPVAIVMSGGYAPDVDDIVAIHLNTIRAAAAAAAAWPLESHETH
ncbi:MAG: histone deacetylase [Acidobacteriota bacterium]